MKKKPTVYELEKILDSDDPGKVTIQPDGSVVVQSLWQEMRDVLNKHSAENASGTPDFILAMYLESCLLAFNMAVQQRETWRGAAERPLERTAVLTSDSPHI